MTRSYHVANSSAGGNNTARTTSPFAKSSAAAAEFEAILNHRKRTSAREREKLETQHAETTSLLNVKLAELRRLQNADDRERRRAAQYMISSLESTLREIDTRHRLSNIEDEELELDMASFRQQQQQQQYSTVPSKNSSPLHQQQHLPTAFPSSSATVTTNNDRRLTTSLSRNSSTHHPQLRRQERTLEDEFYNSNNVATSYQAAPPTSSSFTTNDSCSRAAPNNNNNNNNNDLLSRTKQSAQTLLQRPHILTTKYLPSSTFNNVSQPATKLLSFLSSKINIDHNAANNELHRNSTNKSQRFFNGTTISNPSVALHTNNSFSNQNYDNIINANHIGHHPMQNSYPAPTSTRSFAAMSYTPQLSRRGSGTKDTVYASSDYAAANRFASSSKSTAERDVDYDHLHPVSRANYELYSSSQHNPSTFHSTSIRQQNGPVEPVSALPNQYYNNYQQKVTAHHYSSHIKQQNSASSPQQHRNLRSSSPPPPLLQLTATRSLAAAQQQQQQQEQSSSFLRPHFPLCALPAASAITSESIASSSQPSVPASGNSAETETLVRHKQHHLSSTTTSTVDELKNKNNNNNNCRPDSLTIYDQQYDTENNAADSTKSYNNLFNHTSYMLPTSSQQQQQQPQHARAALAPPTTFDQQRERPHSALLDTGADRQYAQQLIDSINVLTSKYNNSNHSGSESSLTLSQQELNRPLKNVAAVLASAASTLAQREYQQQTYNSPNMNFLGKPAAPATVPLHNQQQQQPQQHARAALGGSEPNMSQLEREVRELEVNMREQTLRGSPPFGGTTRTTNNNNYALPNNLQQHPGTSTSQNNMRPMPNAGAGGNPNIGAPYGGSGSQPTSYNSTAYANPPQNSSYQPLLPKTDALLRGGNYPDDSTVLQRHHPGGGGGGDMYTTQQHQPLQHQNTASSTLSSGLGTMSSMGSNGVASQHSYNSGQPNDDSLYNLAGSRAVQPGGNNNTDYNKFSSQQQQSSSYGTNSNLMGNSIGNPRMSENTSFLQRYDNPPNTGVPMMRPNSNNPGGMNSGANRFGQPAQQTAGNPLTSSSLFGGAFGGGSGPTGGATGLFSKLRNLADTTTQQILTGLEIPNTTAAPFQQQQPSFYPQARPTQQQQQPRQQFGANRVAGDSSLMQYQQPGTSSYGGLSSSSVLTTTTTTTTAGLLPSLLPSAGGVDLRGTTMRPTLPAQQQYPPASYQTGAPSSASSMMMNAQQQRQQQYPVSSYNDSILLQQQQQQQMRPTFANNLIQPLQMDAQQREQLLLMQQQQQQQLQRLPAPSSGYNEVLRQFQQQHQLQQQQQSSALIEPIPVYKLHGAGTSAQAGFFESKIDYDPTKHSLNNNASQFELPLARSDLILVRGTQKDRLMFPEQEGYVVGENVHGNSGLVPIQALDRVSDQITLQTLQQRYPQTTSKWFVAQPPPSSGAGSTMLTGAQQLLAAPTVSMMGGSNMVTVMPSNVMMSMNAASVPQQQQMWLTAPAGVAGSSVASSSAGTVMAYPVVSVAHSYPTSAAGMPGASNTAFLPQHQQLAMQQLPQPPPALNFSSALGASLTYNTAFQHQPSVSQPQQQQYFVTAPANAMGVPMQPAQQMYMQQQPQQNVSLVTAQQQQQPTQYMFAASAPPALVPGSTVVLAQQPTVTNSGMLTLTSVPQQQPQQQQQQQYLLTSSQPNIVPVGYAQSQAFAQQPGPPQALLPGQQFSHIPIQFSEVLGQLPLSEKYMHEAGLHQDPSVPPPENLTVEKTLIKSVLIAWEHADIPSGLLDSYNVYVDGKFRHNVKSVERTRALVENISSGEPHRVSVRSVTVMGSESDDSQCTIMVGKNASHAPYNLRVSNISASSATLTWLPANSAYEHAIFVNNREYAIVPRRVYKFTVGELKPSQVYRIKIVSRSPSVGKINPQYLTATVDFRTLPDNVPDPPTAVQVESGPQDGSILITWRPLPPQQSQKCGVIGYAIYADGHKVTQIDSPSGDHVLLDSVDAFPAQAFPKFITVRSLSNKHHSRDSSPAHINRQLLPLVRKTQKASFFRNSGVPESQIPTYMSSNPHGAKLPPLNSLPYQQQQYLPPGASSVYGPTSSTFVPPVCQYYDEILPGDAVGSSYRDPQLSPRYTTTFPPARTNTTSMSRALRTTGVNDPYIAGYQLESPSMYAAEAAPGVYDPLYARNTALPVSTLRRSGLISRMDSLGIRPAAGTTSGLLPSSTSVADRSLADPFVSATTTSTAAALFGNAAAAYMIPKVGTGLGFDERDELSDIIEEEEEALAAEIRSANASAATAISALYSQPNTQTYDQMLNSIPVGAYVTGGPLMTPYGPQPQSMMPAGGFQSPFQLTPAPGGVGGMQYAGGMQQQMGGGLYGPDPHQQQFYNQNMYGQMMPRQRLPPPRMLPDQMHYQTMGRGGLGPQPNVRAQGHMPEPRVSSNQWSDSATRHQHPGANVRPATAGPENFDRDNATHNVRQQNQQQQEQQQQPQQQLVRVFRAVFDYDPMTMSPNPDAASEELGFKEGELIRVMGEKDTDGFYFGELDGRTGYIPYNMISEVQDQAIVRDFLGRATTTTDAGRAYDDRSGGARKRMVALYDYNPTEASPNVDADAELSFRAGDFITVFGEPDDDGFYAGELRNRRGLVPSNFLREAGGASSSTPGAHRQQQTSANQPAATRSQNYQQPSSGGDGGRGHSSSRSRTAERQRSSASLNRGGGGGDRGSGGEGGGGASSAGRGTSSRETRGQRVASHERGHDRGGGGGGGNHGSNQNNNNNQLAQQQHHGVGPGSGQQQQSSSNTTHAKMLMDSGVPNAGQPSAHARLTHQQSLSRNSSAQHLLHGGSLMGSHSVPNAS